MTAERLEKPCEDPHEESFRQAYNRMLASHTHIHAQLKATEKRLQVTEDSAVKSIQKLDAYLQKVQKYLVELWNGMDAGVQKKFMEKHGKPPLEFTLK